MRELLLGDSTRALTLLGGAVLVLLAVASINVASLLLAWLPARRQEFLVRMALGATDRGSWFGDYLVETLMWALAGTVGGLVLAGWFVQLFGALSIRVDLEVSPNLGGCRATQNWLSFVSSSKPWTRCVGNHPARRRR